MHQRGHHLHHFRITPGAAGMALERWIRNRWPREAHQVQKRCGIYKDNKGLSERTDTLGISRGASERFINVGGVCFCRAP
jgi:hypothetical protein